MRLLTRRSGELDWHDRGEQRLPLHVVRREGRPFDFDGSSYAVEDVFDDGGRTMVWARAAGSGGFTGG